MRNCPPQWPQTWIDAADKRVLHRHRRPEPVVDRLLNPYLADPAARISSPTLLRRVPYGRYAKKT